MRKIKTIGKILGGIVIGYSVLNSLFLTWVGMGKIMARGKFDEENGLWEEWYEIDQAVIDDTVEAWKWFLRGAE